MSSASLLYKSVGRGIVLSTVVTSVLFAPNALPAELEDAKLVKVCRATISVVMGRDVSIIVAEQAYGGIAKNQYVRPDDGTVWKNQCKVVGDRVIWASVDIDGPGTGPGRWRDQPEDEVISYILDGSNVEITQKFADGSVSKELVEFK